MTKRTKLSLRPAKTQIRLGICPVWSESLLSAWRNIGSSVTHWAHCKDSDQTGWMPKLIWVFAGCTDHFVDLSWGGSNAENMKQNQLRTTCKHVNKLNFPPNFLSSVTTTQHGQIHLLLCGCHGNWVISSNPGNDIGAWCHCLVWRHDIWRQVTMKSQLQKVSL